MDVIGIGILELIFLVLLLGGAGLLTWLLRPRTYVLPPIGAAWLRLHLSWGLHWSAVLGGIIMAYGIWEDDTYGLFGHRSTVHRAGYDMVPAIAVLLVLVFVASRFVDPGWDGWRGRYRGERVDS